MSFWDLSTGESAADTGKEYIGAGGDDMEPIPHNTTVLATVGGAAWKQVFQGTDEFVNVKWSILKPEAYAGRVVFQKLFIDDLDPNTKDKSGAFDKEKAIAKRDKHKRMLMAIDANAKGKLARATSKPDDDDLALALTGAQMVIRLMVWDKMEDGRKVPGGNWVKDILPKGSEISEAKEAPKKAVSGGGGFADDLGDDIPF